MGEKKNIPGDELAGLKYYSPYCPVGHLLSSFMKTLRLVPLKTREIANWKDREFTDRYFPFVREGADRRMGEKNRSQ